MGSWLVLKEQYSNVKLPETIEEEDQGDREDVDEDEADINEEVIQVDSEEVDEDPDSESDMDIETD